MIMVVVNKKSNEISLLNNLWKIYFAKLFGTFELTAAIYVLFLQANNLSFTTIMILQGYFTFIMVLLEVPSGAIADFIGRRESLILGQIGSVITFFIYGFSNNLFWFFVAETLWAVGWSLKSGSDSALIYDSLKINNKEGTFKKSMGIMSAIIMFSLGLSTIVGGFIANVFGFRPIFFITGIICSISIIFYWLLEEPSRIDKNKDYDLKSYINHLKISIKFSLKNNQIKKYLVYYSFYGFSGFLVFMFFQPFLANYNLRIYVIGICLSGYFFINSIGHLLSEKISSFFKNDDLILISIIPIAGLLFVLTYFVNIWIAIICLYLILFINSLKDNFTEHAIHKNTSSKNRATIISIKNMVSSFMYSLFAPLFGFVADKVSIKHPYLIYGILLFVFWFICLYFFKKYNDNAEKVRKVDEQKIYGGQLVKSTLADEEVPF
jgi:MFS family permease